MNSLDSFQIQARRRHEYNQDIAFLFVGSGKSYKLRESYKGNLGTVIAGQNHLKLGLGLILTREGSTMSFILHNNSSSRRLLKRFSIQIENNYANFHQTVRLCNGESVFLFYHESKAEIEIRSLTSLKKTWSLDLTQMCNKFNLLKYLDQIKASLDFDSITHLGKIVLLLANKLILVKKDSVDQSEVVFDCSELTIKERLMGLRYNFEQRILLVIGMTSFFLFGFDDKGLSYSRNIGCNQLGRAIRLLGWDPKEEFILIAQRIMGDHENYHLIDYRTSDPMIINFLNGKLLLGNCYDSINHRLFYIEVGSDQRKDIRTVSFRDFREKYVLNEPQQQICEIEFDTDIYTPLPPISKMFTFYLMDSLNDRLFFKPLRGIDERFLKDLPLRMSI